MGSKEDDNAANVTALRLLGTTKNIDIPLDVMNRNETTESGCKDCCRDTRGSGPVVIEDLTRAGEQKPGEASMGCLVMRLMVKATKERVPRMEWCMECCL